MKTVCGRRGENSRRVHFLLLSLTKVLFWILENKTTKLIGIDFRFGCDPRIPQIIRCVLVAEIVNVQIENALVCMRYGS